MLVGLTVGAIIAFGGAWKDAPAEGFDIPQVLPQSVPNGGVRAPACQLTNSYLQLAVAAIGYERAVAETYKTFFFPSKPRGKFAGKPVLFPAMLTRRQYFVPAYAAIWDGGDRDGARRAPGRRAAQRPKAGCPRAAASRRNAAVRNGTKRVGILMLGCGLAARMHSRTLRRIGGVELFYASRQRERAESYCRRYGGRRAFGSYAEGLADPLVDVALVATPTVTHRDLPCQSLAARQACHRGEARVHAVERCG
jgi:hypothetical protein